MNYVIYGKGNCGKLVRETLLKTEHKIIAQIDRYSLINSKLLDYPVIVAVFNAKRNANFPAIRRYLLKKGFKSIYSFEQFYHYFYKLLPDNYFWLVNYRYYYPNMKEVGNVYNLWADKKSRRIYKEILCYRFSNNLSLPRPDTANKQYLPDDVPIKFSSIKNFVDGGAFTGDTLKRFIKKKITLQKIVAFEPCKDNFIMLSNLALSDRKKLINFTNLGANSNCGKGNNKVNTIAFDNFTFTPDYIKLDIEGYEKKALLGMKKTILEHHPVLAIALYHKPQDLFEIPLLIHTWDKKAKFYLRVYGEHCLETILYVLWSKK